MNPLVNVPVFLLIYCLLLRWTEAQDPKYPKPSISVRRDPEEPGRYWIKCSAPLRYSVTWFRLMRDKEEYRHQNGSLYELKPEPRHLLPTATFSVCQEGRYKCFYFVSDINYSERYELSAHSDAVTVRDLPKPTISVEKDPGERGGYRVHCSESTIRESKRFTIYRGQDPKYMTVWKAGVNMEKVNFPLPTVTAGTEEVYWCSYHIPGEGLESPYSDPAVITGPTETPPPDTNSQLALYISIPCAIVLFVLLLVILMYYRTSRRKKVTGKIAPREIQSMVDGTTLTPATAANTRNVPAEKENKNLTVVVREREGEDEEGVTYAELNPKALKTKNEVSNAPMPESSIYAAVKVN